MPQAPERRCSTNPPGQACVSTPPRPPRPHSGRLAGRAPPRSGRGPGAVAWAGERRQSRAGAAQAERSGGQGRLLRGDSLEGWCQKGSAPVWARGPPPRSGGPGAAESRLGRSAPAAAGGRRIRAPGGRRPVHSACPRPAPRFKRALTDSRRPPPARGAGARPVQGVAPGDEWHGAWLVAGGEGAGFGRARGARVAGERARAGVAPRRAKGAQVPEAQHD